MAAGGSDPRYHHSGPSLSLIGAHRMALSDPLTPTDGPNLESSKSAIHWASILGGAVAAASISAILLPLGAAFGLASTSAYDPAGSLVTFTAGMAIWLIVMQWVSSCVGGYLAGRLRVKWADTHSDEVFFRDTAHGFLSWAVATILTLGLAVFLTFGSINSTVQTGASLLSDADVDYYADSLYRSGTVSAGVAPANLNEESARILAKGAVSGSFDPSDRSYLEAQVAARTGLSQSEANARVSITLSQIDTARNKALAAAETARKAMVAFHTALCISLLIGAFIASVSAALGGRLRDNY
jgi:hypothetical protein